MPNFTINYLSEKDLDQVHAACIYALGSLDFNIEEINFINFDDTYYLSAEKRQYSWFKDFFIKIHIIKLDNKKKLTINFELDGMYIKSPCCIFTPFV